MWLFIAFIAVPIIEISLFIQVGGLIGLWPTLAIVLITAILGTAMVRTQGMQVLAKLQNSMAGNGNPAEQMVHGAMILFSGALLLTPGFFTDAVGFALLIPAVRVALFDWGRRNVKMQSMHIHTQGFGQRAGDPRRGRNPFGDPGTIDGEFTEIDPDTVESKPTDRPSEWTKR